LGRVYSQTVVEHHTAGRVYRHFGCMMVCSMTRSKVKVKLTSLWKLDILPFSKVISCTIYNGSWQLTTDS